MKKLPIILAVSAAAAGIIGGLWWTLGRGGSASSAGSADPNGKADAAVPANPVWPDESVKLTPIALVFEPTAGVKRIYLDAGHGAKDNSGNMGALGKTEASFTLSLARDIGEVLAKHEAFEVRICREPDELVGYRDRVAEAETWKADVFVSLHSDVRHPEGVGYSVLWSDEADAALNLRRVTFARAMAKRLGELGLPAYDGLDYADDYAGDEVPGVFVDRHEPGQRIFVLRKPTMPSIIVETHNAKSEPEALRWEQPDVRSAFATAVAQAVISATE